MKDTTVQIKITDRGENGVWFSKKSLFSTSELIHSSTDTQSGTHCHTHTDIFIFKDTVYVQTHKHRY